MNAKTPFANTEKFLTGLEKSANSYLEDEANQTDVTNEEYEQVLSIVDCIEEIQDILAECSQIIDTVIEPEE